MWFQAFILLTALGTIGAAATVTLIAGLRGRWTVAKNAAIAAGVVACGYTLLMLGAALATGDRVLAPGMPKYVCELDCHFSYTVMDVVRAGRRVTIRVKVEFDRETINDRRPAAPLRPGPRKVWLRDGQGGDYEPVRAGDLSMALRPGERYTTSLAFDVDSAAAGLVLYIADADPAKKLLIGSDNSPFRRPTGLLTLKE